MSRAAHIDELNLAARACGYRLAVFGEIAGVTELIAAPWTESARCAAKLLQAMVDSLRVPAVMLTGPMDRPLGRTVYVLTLGPEMQFVVNVMPRYAIFRIAPPGPETGSPSPETNC